MALSHCILLVSAALMAGDDHLKVNPVYRHLRQAGVAIHEDFHQPLPAPTMADGLDQQAQEEAIQRIAKRSYPLSRFVRKSVVAHACASYERCGQRTSEVSRAQR